VGPSARHEGRDGPEQSEEHVPRWPKDGYAAAVANEALVQSIKEIVARAKDGDVEGSYRGYRDLFTSADFATYRVEDQRQALRLMILKKGAPQPPTTAMTEAHSAVLGLLTELVSTHSEPSDYELLGVCHVVLGNEESASGIFKAALAIERGRDPSSTLCGALMKRVSML
jgi:mRNA-degrading endonuclease YafQ of YafQ-DinJ toxin-antitoxin module